MLRLVHDENFNGDIVRGLFRRHPELECKTLASGRRLTPTFWSRPPAKPQTEIGLSSILPRRCQNRFKTPRDEGARELRISQTDIKPGQTSDLALQSWHFGAKPLGEFQRRFFPSAAHVVFPGPRLQGFKAIACQSVGRKLIGTAVEERVGE